MNEQPKRKIWCIEDDSSIREILVFTLNSCGFEAQGFEEAEPFWKAFEAAESKPDLILLDIMLPHSSGSEILAVLRNKPESRQIPVIMTTARSMESDKIKALEAGADDYLVKPFGMMEMVARIRAVLRRCSSQASGQTEHGPFSVDPAEHSAKLDGKKLSLTRKEFDLLLLLCQNPGKAFSRDALLEKIWQVDGAIETRTVDAHIGSLRSKLGEYGSWIETVRSIGYRMKKDADQGV